MATGTWGVGRALMQERTTAPVIPAPRSELSHYTSSWRDTYTTSIGTRYAPTRRKQHRHHTTWVRRTDPPAGRRSNNQAFKCIVYRQAPRGTARPSNACTARRNADAEIGRMIGPYGLVVTMPWQKNAACSAVGHKPNASSGGGGEVAQETRQRGAGGGADRPLAVVLPGRAVRGRSAPVGGHSEGRGEVRAPCVAPVPIVAGTNFSDLICEKNHEVSFTQDLWVVHGQSVYSNSDVCAYFP